MSGKGTNPNPALVDYALIMHDHKFNQTQVEIQPKFIKPNLTHINKTKQNPTTLTKPDFLILKSSHDEKMDVEAFQTTSNVAGEIRILLHYFCEFIFQHW